METHQQIQELGITAISTICNFSKSDFEIINMSFTYSPLNLEVHILFSIQLGKGLFDEEELRELRYDYSNKCGVLTDVPQHTYRNPKILESFGDLGILSEKEWI